MINFLPVTPCVDSFNWIARFCNIVHHGGSSYNDFAQDSLQQGTQDCAAYAGEIPQRSAFLIPQLAIQVLVPQQKNSVLIVKPGQHGRVAVIGGSLEYVTEQRSWGWLRWLSSVGCDMVGCLNLSHHSCDDSWQRAESCYLWAICGDCKLMLCHVKLLGRWMSYLTNLSRSLSLILRTWWFILYYQVASL